MTNPFFFEPNFTYEPAVKQIDDAVVERDLTDLRRKIVEAIKDQITQKDLSITPRAQQAIDYAISKLEESKEVEIPKRKMKRINYENKSFKTSKNNS